MHNRMHRDGLAIGLAAFTLAMPIDSSTAESSTATVEFEPPPEELMEELVTGTRSRQATQKAQTHFNWLARLVGEFTIEGYVDVSPRGGTREVLTAEGTARCVGFGVAPGVHCELRVRWPGKEGTDGRDIPGAVPTLDPAMMLFGFKENGYNYELLEYEISEFSIKHVLVDNKGIFESGHGVLVDADTMESKSNCAAVRVDCERMVRMVANPDLRTVEVLVALTIEGHEASRYVLLMSRVPGSKAEVFGRKAPKEERK